MIRLSLISPTLPRASKAANWPIRSGSLYPLTSGRQGKMGKVRVGFGFDVHQLKTQHPFVLGGVNLAHHAGAFGHSDADVLLHAICDALLGAANLRDIGYHFSNTDERWKGISSLILLQQVTALLKDKNWQIGNIDAMV